MWFGNGTIVELKETIGGVGHAIGKVRGHVAGRKANLVGAAAGQQDVVFVEGKTAGGRLEQEAIAADVKSVVKQRAIDQANNGEFQPKCGLFTCGALVGDSTADVEQQILVGLEGQIAAQSRETILKRNRVEKVEQKRTCVGPPSDIKNRHRGVGRAQRNIERFVEWIFYRHITSNITYEASARTIYHRRRESPIRYFCPKNFLSSRSEEKQ